MERKHGRFSGASHENQYQPPGQGAHTKKGRRNNILQIRRIQGGEPLYKCSEIKCSGMKGKDKDSDEETQVGKAGNDECFLTRRYCGGFIIIKSDEQEGRNPHQLPENV